MDGHEGCLPGADRDGEAISGESLAERAEAYGLADGREKPATKFAQGQLCAGRLLAIRLSVSITSTDRLMAFQDLSFADFTSGSQIGRIPLDAGTRGYLFTELNLEAAADQLVSSIVVLGAEDTSRSRINGAEEQVKVRRPVTFVMLDQPHGMISGNAVFAPDACDGA